MYLIDGYNVTKGDPATRDLGLEAQRDELVRRLCSRGRTLLGDGRIVVVFDGASRVGSRSEVAAGVEIRYSSEGHKADDVLVALAGEAREAVVLVTNDRGLIDRVRTHAKVEVRVLGRETVFAEARPRKGPRGGRKERITRDVGLPPGAGGITRELKELWLNGDAEE